MQPEPEFSKSDYLIAAIFCFVGCGCWSVVSIMKAETKSDWRPEALLFGTIFLCAGLRIGSPDWTDFWNGLLSLIIGIAIGYYWRAK